uniref:Tubulin-specific chaperone E n=1 Tax=Parastrongyloides trichosuri TaxID=131310 RepID=A0A0N4Z8Q3_PARTI
MTSNVETGYLAPIGTRILLHDERIGTIRFIGKLKGREGIRYGVELDENIGKHDGMFEGERYFQTEKSKSGVFVFPKDVRHPTDLISCIKDKYNPTINDNGGIINIMNGKEVQLLIDKDVSEALCDIYSLERISLEKLPIGYIKNEDICEEKYFHKCKTLFIKQCLITKWKHLFNILKVFPKLEELSVLGNRLDDLQECLAKHTKTYKGIVKNIKILSVADCFLNEDCINSIPKIFRNLGELLIAVNPITSFCPATKLNVDSLKKLVMDECIIKDLGSLKKGLLKLPNLEEISLVRSQVENIPSNMHLYFPRLKSISLKFNDISSWKIINNIKKFPELKILEIELSKLPTYSDNDDVLDFVIAKLPNITTINKHAITGTERSKAEMIFLRDVPATEPDHIEDIQRLREVYGDIVSSTYRDREQTKMKLGSLRIEVVKDDKSHTMTVPLSLTFTALIIAASKKLRFSKSSIKSINIQMKEDIIFVEKNLFSSTLADFHLRTDENDIIRLILV